MTAAELAVRFRDIEMLAATLALGLSYLTVVQLRPPPAGASLLRHVVADGWTDGQVILAKNWNQKLMS